MLKYSKELETKRMELKGRLLDYFNKNNIDDPTDSMIITCCGDVNLVNEWQELYFSTGEWVGDFKSFFTQNR